MAAIDELKEIGLKVFQADSPDASPIDLSIADEEDNVAWIWGSAHDLEWECNHPSEFIEYDDDETVGECALCGATCQWHKEAIDDEGHIGRVPHEWTPPHRLKGILGRLIDENYKVNPF